MVGIAMPNEERLPPGPRRDLVTALHDLYELAGKPSARLLSAAIRDRDDLPGTLSHEGISAILRGVGGCPRWHNLLSLVRVLLDGAVSKRDAEPEVLRIHALWRLANGGIRLATPALSGQEEITIVPVSSPVSGQGDGSTVEDMEQESQESKESIAGATYPGMTWNHPRYGRFDFFDRRMVTEVIREVGKLNE